MKFDEIRNFQIHNKRPDTSQVRNKESLRAPGEIVQTRLMHYQLAGARTLEEHANKSVVVFTTLSNLLHDPEKICEEFGDAEKNHAPRSADMHDSNVSDAVEHDAKVVIRDICPLITIDYIRDQMCIKSTVTVKLNEKMHAPGFEDPVSSVHRLNVLTLSGS